MSQSDMTREQLEGAVMALKMIAQDAAIDGGKAYSATMVYRESPDRLTSQVDVVDVSDLIRRAELYGAKLACMPPQPDLRAALVEARAVIERFAIGGVADCLGREDYSVMRERIVDWHGPTDFIQARAALVRIDAALEGKP